MNKKRANATKPLDWGEAKKGMLLLENQKDYHSLLLVAIGFYTGYRLSDILILKYSDFAEGKENLIVTEKKTGKQRVIPILPQLRRIVQLCQKALNKKDEYFIFTRIRFNSSKPINVAAGIDRVKKAFRLAGFEVKKDTSQVLRKTFAVRFFELAKKEFGEEIALIKLSKILNHATLNASRTYIGLSEKIEADIFKKFD